MRNTWHFRLYGLTRRQLDTFWGRGENDPKRFEGQYVESVNLCPYLRTILLWGPTLLVAHAAAIFLPLYEWVYLPRTWVPRATVEIKAALPDGTTMAATAVWGMGFVACIIVAFAVAIGLTYLAIRLIQRCIANKKKGVGFCFLLAEMYVAWHARTCPVISVEAAPSRISAPNMPRWRRSARGNILILFLISGLFGLMVNFFIAHDEMWRVVPGSMEKCDVVPGAPVWARCPSLGEIFPARNVWQESDGSFHAMCGRTEGALTGRIRLFCQ